MPYGGEVIRQGPARLFVSEQRVLEYLLSVRVWCVHSLPAHYPCTAIGLREEHACCFWALALTGVSLEWRVSNALRFVPLGPTPLCCSTLNVANLEAVYEDEKDVHLVSRPGWRGGRQRCINAVVQGKSWAARVAGHGLQVAAASSAWVGCCLARWGYLAILLIKTHL